MIATSLTGDQESTRLDSALAAACRCSSRPPPPRARLHLQSSPLGRAPVRPGLHYCAQTSREKKTKEHSIAKALVSSPINTLADHIADISRERKRQQYDAGHVVTMMACGQGFAKSALRRTDLVTSPAHGEQHHASTATIKNEGSSDQFGRPLRQSICRYSIIAKS